MGQKNRNGRESRRMVLKADAFNLSTKFLFV